MKADFLLNSKTALELYEEVRGLPIIDYHNHLSVSDIATDKRFTDILELWIAPDPYKHRAMRMRGVPERYITGEASSEEKFEKWCETLPHLFGNPLYHWSLMELSTVFGIDELPTQKNAKEIYRCCNEYLSRESVTSRSLLERFNVELACPCVSLLDDLSCLEGIANVAPSLRGDDIVAPSEDFLKRLSSLTVISAYDDNGFSNAVKKRLDAFEANGLVFTDHALDNGFCFDADRDDVKRLIFLAGEYAKRDLVMQLHIGAQRFTSTKLREAAGAAGGYAGIGNSVDVQSLTSLLDAVDMREHRLPKTVLFTLNPADNALISVLSGSYSRDGVSGLITQGPAWWWCDHKQGILDMLEHTAAFSLVSNFVGMTTDSRSFLSFVRHDYFRRILCDWLGKKIDDGEPVSDIEYAKSLAYDLCYGNAKRIINKKGRKEK